MEAILAQNAWKKAALAIAVGLALVPCYSMAGPLPVNPATNAIGVVTPDIGRNPIRCFAVGAHSGTAGPMITPAYERARAFLGSTPEEIQQKFAAIQEMNFARANATQIISRLSDKELASVAFIYQQSAPAGENDLLRIFAQKLDSRSLIRVAKAFGRNEVSQAVEKYTPVKVRQDFIQELKVVPVDTSYAPAIAFGITEGGHTLASPNIGMTLQEIYLEFRTAPVGSLRPAAALTETGIYAGAYLYGSWKLGYSIGTGIHDLIEAYDPSLDDVIGGTIDSAIQDINEAATEFEQGNYENSLDSLFGFGLGNTGDYSGDWNVGASYSDYESEGGGGGC